MSGRKNSFLPLLTIWVLSIGVAVDGCADGGDVGSITASGDERGQIPSDAFEDAIVPTDGHPGWTPGSAHVEHDGSASFEVPLEVPAGRNGIEPALSLSYNSRRGDGLLGTGWSLAGMSAITRCGRTERIDGEASEITFGPTDAFCLDGERLVDGEFWGGGEYRQFRNGFDRIQMEGSIDSPSLTFTVWKRDGTIWTYGGSPQGAIRGPRVTYDSAGVLSTTPTVSYAWLLTRVEDRHGNYMEYHYGHDVHTDYSLETYPTEIVYSGHPTLGPGQRRVVFHYRERSPGAAPGISWIQGFGMRTTQELYSIEMIAPGSPSTVRDYQLGYQVSSATRALRLSTVEECDGWGKCKEPITFRWTGTNLDDPDPESWLRPVDAVGHRTNMGGVNAEPPGRASLLRAGSPLQVSSWPQSQFAGAPGIVHAEVEPSSGVSGDWLPRSLHVLREDLGASTHGELWETSTAGEFLFELSDLDQRQGIIPFDYDRDGHPDFLRHFRLSSGNILLELVRLDHHSVPPELGEPVWSSVWLNQYGSCNYASAVSAYLADLDGNGVADLIRGCANPSDSWKVQLHDGGAYGSYADYATAIPFPLGQPVGAATIHVVEWDGDPGAELLVPNSGSGWYDVHELSAGVHQVRQTNLRVDGSFSPVFLDANGDGLTDVALLTQHTPGDPVQLRMNVGAALAPPRSAIAAGDPDAWIWNLRYNPFAGIYARTATDVRVGDLNQDGRDDLLAFFELDEAVDVSGGRTSICDPDDPTRCIFSPGPGERFENLMLASLSDGESFHTLRFGTAGQHTSSYLVPDISWPQAQLIDLGADGVPDVVYSDHWRSCAVGEPPSEDCGDDNSWVYVRPSRFPRAPDLLEAAWAGSPSTVEGGDYEVGQLLGEFHYGQVSDGQAGQDCQFPLRCVSEGLRVVTDFWSGGPEGSARGRGIREKHWYQDPVTDLGGQGFLGFGRHFTEDSTGRVTETRFDHRRAEEKWGYPYAGLPAESWSYQRTDDALERYRVEHAEYTYSLTPLSDRHYAVQPDRTDVRVYEVASVEGGCEPVDPYPGCGEFCRVCTPVQAPTAEPLAAHFVDADYDSHGSLVRLDRGTANDHTTADVVLDDRPSDWLVGLPHRVTTTSTALVDGVLESATRMIDRNFDADGFLTTRIAEPEDSTRRVTTTYGPNAYGQVVSVTDAATGLVPRTTEIGYDPEYIFVRWVTDPEHHTRTYAVHPGLGKVVLTIDLNGVESRTHYDGFGRQRESWTVGLESAKATTQYDRVGDDLLRVDRYQAGHGRETLDLDFLGFVHQERSQLPDRWVVQDHTYDNLGRLIETFGPHEEAGSYGVRRTYHYDNLRRVTWIEMHDGDAPPMFEYDGLRTTSTDRRGHQIFTTQDAFGRVVERTESLPTPITVTRSFGPFGTLRRISHSGGTDTTNDYDAYGRLTRSVDPDVGTRHLYYTAFGELDHVTTGSGTSLREITQRDQLGRVEEEWSPEDGTTRFEWDTAANGLGRLAWAVTDGGVMTSFEYDTLGREVGRTQQVRGEDFEITREYDAYGRTEIIGYPDPKKASRFRVRYEYGDPATAGARVQQVSRDLDGGSWEALWTADTYDRTGAVSASTFGNGISELRTFEHRTGRLESIHAAPAIDETIGYDPNGNVTLRQNDISGRTEGFLYDDLNRISEWTGDSGTGPFTLSYHYDDLGNLIDNGGVVQSFGESGAGPHQLTSTSLGATFTYDSLGRREDPELPIDAWASNDLPRLIDGPSGTTEIEYDAFGSRVRKETEPDITVYMGGLYERSSSSGIDEHSYHVFVEGRAIAEVREDSDGDRKVYYLHENYQGSLAAVTNGLGAVEQYVRYDPYGARTAEKPGGGIVSPFGLRGYTLHEHDDELGLINMRGRMYDPTTGTFLTVDPIIRSTTSSEALNGYSYVENNPVTWTDPSGFRPDRQTPWPDEAGGWVGLIVAGIGYLVDQFQTGPGGGGSSSGISSGGSSGRPRRQAPAHPVIAGAFEGVSGGDSLSGHSGPVQQSVSWITSLSRTARALQRSVQSFDVNDAVTALGDSPSGNARSPGALICERHSALIPYGATGQVAFGVEVTGNLAIGPWGGVLGLNLEHTTTEGWGLYLITPDQEDWPEQGLSLVHTFGLDFSANATANLAGSRVPGDPWEGRFHSAGASVGPVGWGMFTGNDPSAPDFMTGEGWGEPSDVNSSHWTGMYVGGSGSPLPGSLAYQRTEYTRLWHIGGGTGTSQKGFPEP